VKIHIWMITITRFVSVLNFLALQEMVKKVGGFNYSNQIGFGIDLIMNFVFVFYLCRNAYTYYITPPLPQLIDIKTLIQ